MYEIVDTRRARPASPGTRRRAAHVLALGHGAGGGIEARDLQALAPRCPPTASPSRWSSSPGGSPGRRCRRAQDARRGLAGALARAGLGPGCPWSRAGAARARGWPAGPRAELGAAAVLALSFPLHPPGRPEKSRAEELTGAGLPTLVVQGGRDPFGQPAEFPRRGRRIVEVPDGDHGFAVPKRADSARTRR